MFFWTVLKAWLSRQSPGKRARDLGIVTLLFFAGDRLLQEVDKRHQDAVSQMRNEVGALRGLVDVRHEHTMQALGKLENALLKEQSRVWELYLEERRRRRQETAERRQWILPPSSSVAPRGNPRS